MQDKEKIREKYGPEWARLPPAQQDEIIDRCLVGPRAPPAADAGDLGDPARFPGLRGPTGQKLVRFGDEVGAAGLGRLGRSGRREGVQTSPGEGTFTKWRRSRGDYANLGSDEALPLSSLALDELLT